MKKKDNHKKGEGIEELLIRLRKEKGWTYTNLLMKLEDKTLTEKEIRKWEVGLKYPELNQLYQLSEIYQIPSQKLIQAKNTSYENGMASININTIKWISYFLNVSMKVGMVILVIIYVLLLMGSLWFFVTMASLVDRSKLGL